MLIISYIFDNNIRFTGSKADEEKALETVKDPVNQLTRIANGVVSLIQQQEERNNQLITQLEYLASRQLGVKFDESKMRDLPDEMKMMIKAQEDESKRNDVISGIIDTIRNDSNPYEKIRNELMKRGITDEGQVQQAIQLYEKQRWGRIGVNFGDLQFIEETMRSLGASKDEIKQKQEEYLEGKFNLPANRVKKQPIEESGVKAPVLNILSENTGLLSKYESHPKQMPDIELQRKDNEQIIKKAIQSGAKKLTSKKILKPSDKEAV